MATPDTDLSPVPSPCIGVCTLDENDICVGCLRSIDEICAWAAAAEDEKRAILARATARGRGVRRA